LLLPSLNHAGLILRPVATLILLFAPLCFAIAILRSRLWDIDILINRTLVYGLLTASLALVYAVLVIGLQFLIHRQGGPGLQSPLVVVGSTLVIAALFRPLRRRIQAIIDRRFYRRKYDAVKALAAFSATLRNEVDLDQLREQLVAVVEETMQPAHISLWVPPLVPSRDLNTRRLPRIDEEERQLL
jgi:multisubunit Na+/H+ antiporter MnhB subunit